MFAISVVTIIPAVIFITCLYNTNYASRHQLKLVSMAIGALLGNVIYHLLPEALGLQDEKYPALTLTLLLSGLLTFLFGEQMLQQYHHGHGHTHYESAADVRAASPEHLELPQHNEHHQLPSHFGWLLISSDLLHSFIDGIAIGTSFMSSPLTGVSTSLAVFFHEVPHLLGDYSVLVSTGFSRIQLIYYSISVAGSSLLGAILATLLRSLVQTGLQDQVEKGLLAFAAGNFLYISLADLIPEVLIKQSRPAGTVFKAHYLFIIAGALIMLLLRLFIHE